jgi:hypothetical protein
MLIFQWLQVSLLKFTGTSYKALMELSPASLLTPPTTSSSILTQYMEL